MKTIKVKGPIAFWMMIASGLTNTGRVSESKETSNENLKLVDNFATPTAGICGWSEAFPAIIAPIKNWFFEKGFDKQDESVGCTAQEYVDAENKKRAAVLQGLLEELGKASNDQKPAIETTLQNFRDIFCDAKDELHKLTLANAYWVDSGHQRTEWVFIPARLKWLRDRLTVLSVNAAAIARDSSVKAIEYADFPVTVPAIVREYDDLDEVVTTQYTDNVNVQDQTRLNVLDLTKAARFKIGYGGYPRCSETDFRKTMVTGKGATSRLAYHLALLDYHFSMEFGFLKSLFAPEKIKPAGGTGQLITNPDFIPANSLSLDNKYDPMRNPTVINRLVDQTLDSLRDYNSKYGPSRMIKNKKTGEMEPAENLMSPIETAVLDRGYAWTKEELGAWMVSLKPGLPGYKKTITEDPNGEKPKGPNAVMLKNILGATATPLFVKDLVKDIQEGNNAEGNAFDVVSKGNVGKAMQAVKDGHAELQAALVELDFLRDGDPSLYAVTVATIVKVVKDAHASMEKPPVEEPKELVTA